MCIRDSHHTEHELLRYARRLESKDLSLTTSLEPVSYTHLEPTRLLSNSYAVFCLKKKRATIVRRGDGAAAPLMPVSALKLPGWHLLSDVLVVFFLMIRRPPRSTLDRSSAASDVYKRQSLEDELVDLALLFRLHPVI